MASQIVNSCNGKNTELFVIMILFETEIA